MNQQFHFCKIFTTTAFFLTVGVTATNNKSFPKDFLFGVATAAYQIEGAWDTDGKGPSIWDHLTHTRPDFILNKDNADIACDSYHKYKEDIQLIKDLGVDFYRFSLSWPRILPTGFANKINEAGVQYYKNVIKELKENNIIPMVTLYHWDLPQTIQDLGGWANEDTADYFADFARIAFELFGNDVKLWTTINEPKQVCQLGYGIGIFGPAVVSPGIGNYLCAHTILKAHAKAYHIYDKEFRPKQNGRISIVIDSFWFEPASDSKEDEEAAEIRRQFSFGWFAHPIFIGNYPQVMIDRVDERSKKEGFPRSRLPKFSKEEVEFIRGTYDFLGFNTYSTFLTKAKAEADIGTPDYEKDAGGKVYQDPAWQKTTASWIKVVPWGIRKLLVWISKQYNSPEIIITENGVSDSGTLKDDIRISYYKEYLSNVLDAMLEDHVNVTGYTAWSLMDNFEWILGYTQKFGLYSVDFESKDRKRTPKASVNFYKKVVKTHCLVDNCDKHVEL